VLRKISDYVYRIQIRKKEANLHVEQLKLCRASREELREKRKQNRRRMREQRPRFGPEEEETDSDDAASEEVEGRSLYSDTPYEGRNETKPNVQVSTYAPAGNEQEIGRTREGDDVSEASVRLRHRSYMKTRMVIHCAHELSVIIKNIDGRRLKHARR
jgi:hypothetical protein